MNTNTYTLLNKFECCGNPMVTVIINKKAACVMPETDYNRIVNDENEFIRKYGLKVA